MTFDDLLFEVFLKHGLEQNLDKKLIIEVYKHLTNSQFLPAGEREHVRNKLLSIIKSQL
jgi:hypothetical protein